MLAVVSCWVKHARGGGRYGKFRVLGGVFVGAWFLLVDILMLLLLNKINPNTI